MQKKNIKKMNNNELFIFVEFILYSQYFLVKGTNSFYQILTLEFDF